MDFKKISKPLILIVVIIVFSSIFIRACSHSETLAEYAAKNPEIAYKTKEPATPAKVTDSESGRENTRKEGSSNGQPIDHIDSSENEAGEITPESGVKEEEMDTNPDRNVYEQGFYYEPLSDEIKKKITGISYPITESDKDSTAVTAINIVSSSEKIQVSYDDLRYVSVLYYNFKGIERTGELICNKAIAQDLVEIFYELYRNEYQIEQISLIDEYSGDDVLSMLDNNTSCFNYRLVDGTTSLSKHALGLAIDINPFYNPYVVYKNDGTTYISPQGSETYADRSKEFAYKIDENDLCYKLFTEHGFTWGGNWNSLKDYQHFQKVPE
ncbi:D-alanyl-D-alanine carboxypeptidase-like protein [Kineothrix alysoides]|uniref:D-alanyl-D-alanine carboxypeptidase-like protein n=1 Tax=Kineothrix alysoides TaxID=1469948 RepID=A0A4R1QWW9_9FIRM|nr:M15 family metallopeptidase [Kineothrix alysoides]TCL58001.1 D-alanyl-D-alanine carboxypeptidase-like protein [Kineothrix alysoides]